MSNFGNAVPLEVIEGGAQRIATAEEIAARRILATLRTRAHRFRRLNKNETIDVNLRHGTKDEARVTVMQCKHPALKELYANQSAARNRHYELTLPTVEEGFRFVVSGQEMKHAEEMRKFYEKQNSLVDQLVDAGAFRGGAECLKAQAELNGLFDKRAWPHNAEHLRSKFAMGTQYLACPTDSTWKPWLEESGQAAEMAMRDRIKEAMERVAKNCGGDGRLFKTVFTNLQELVDLVPGFDITGRYTKIIEEASEIARYDAEEVRDNKELRKELANRAEEIVGMFGNL